MDTNKAAVLIREGLPQTGSWNMAVDEWLLLQAMSSGQLSFRFYGWAEPTLSLGYFQEKGALEFPASLAPLPRVRRLTGGGAILHDQELTYSLALPASHPLSSTPVELYSLIHRWFITGLAEQGISAAMRGTDQAERNGSFLCFLRGDRHDVMIGQEKILGSAQRRRKGAILQHGSLILQTSPLAESVHGIEQLTGVSVDVERLMESISSQLQQLCPQWDDQRDRLQEENTLQEIRELQRNYLL